MKTITVRDLRQRWPEAEAALQVEEEILITRDSKPVAKLVRLTEARPKRRRWDMRKHARWQRRVAQGVLSRSDDAHRSEACRKRRATMLCSQKK